MDALTIERIRMNPDFQRLESRNIFGWMLAGVMVVIYAAFIGLVAFAPSVISSPVGDGVVTWGIVLGIGVILIAVALTAIYVWRANVAYDPLVRRLQAEAARGIIL